MIGNFTSLIKNETPFKLLLLNRGRKWNSSTVQEITETTYSNHEPKKKKSRRSLKFPSQSNGDEYLARKRIDPKQLQCPDNEGKHFMFGNQERMRLSWILSRKEHINYVVHSWTGFNILIRNEMPILSSNIQYLTSTDSPATEMCIVITVLDRCLKIEEAVTIKIHCLCI